MRGARRKSARRKCILTPRLIIDCCSVPRCNLRTCVRIFIALSVATMEPITLGACRDPVEASDGITYERAVAREVVERPPVEAKAM